MVVKPFDWQKPDFQELRQRMIETQLIARGICDRRVLDAMSQVPREIFVPPELRPIAYEDEPLPIGEGQTISQPYTVAFMLQELKLHGGEKVLDVGTGSGYAAAVLSRMVLEVHTIERIAPLSEHAQRRLAALGYDNVTFHIGDGTLGCAAFAPFDAIVVAAAANRLPDAYGEQLARGGRIVIPLGDPLGQSLYRLTRCDGKLIRENLGRFAFVPLIAD